MRHRNSGAEVEINELMAFERSLPSGICEKENLEMSAEYNYELPLIIPNGLHSAASHESLPDSRLTSQSLPQHQISTILCITTPNIYNIVHI